MIGLGDYIWECRVNEYCKKVFNDIYYWESDGTKNRKYAANKRKFINRCEKVNWSKMEEVRNMPSWKIKDYIRKNADLFTKLWKLDFPNTRLIGF